MARRHPLLTLGLVVALAAAVGHGAAKTGHPQPAQAAGPPVTTSAAGTVALGQQLAAADGWSTGGQWSCLVALWDRESGWSATATNATSGAYGIAQSLHGDQGGTGGDEYNAADPEGLTAAELAAANDGDARQQIRWGLGYIAVTYGTPCGAWQHEQSDGWY